MPIQPRVLRWRMLTKSWLAPGLVTLWVASLVASVPACSGSSSDPDASGGADSSHSSGGDASAGSSDSAVGGEPAGPAGDAGAPGAGGALGDAGAPATSAAEPLPATTFLYVYSETADSDVLMAWDYSTGEQRVVTDLRGDGSEGWEIWGHTISPDRRRIALASLYDPTQADIDTQLATRRIHTIAPDGSDFQRLTPVFENTGAGRKNFSISVEDPAFTADGSSVIYDFGNWWYEGTTLEGGSLPWSVATSGALPELFPTVTSCTVVSPSVNPATGDVLFVHSVCVSSADEGIFLYPREGSTEPTKLVARSYGAGGVDPTLEKASWLADGSGFLFVGVIEVMRGNEVDTASSLLSFDMTSGEVSVLVIPEPDTDIRNAAVAPDGAGIVYCLAHDDVLDLHAIDLTVDPPEDAAITNDGKSCQPGF